MNQYKTDTKNRIAAVALAVIFGTLTVTSGLVAAFTAEMGLYTKPLDKVIKEKQEIVQEMTSMQIFKHRKDIKENEWLLTESNIEYGIIQAENLKNINLADKSNYWDYHFQSTKPSQYSYVSQRMNEGDRFKYNSRLIPSLTGYGMQQYGIDDDTLSISSGVIPVKQLSYCPDDGIFYFSTDSNSYPVTTIGIETSQAKPTDDMLIRQRDGIEIPEELYPGNCVVEPNQENDMAYFRLDDTMKKYVSVSGNYQNLDAAKYSSWTTLSMDTFSTSGSAIRNIKAADLPPKNSGNISISLISPDEAYHYAAENGDVEKIFDDNNAICIAEYTLKREKRDENPYWIISQVKPKDKWVTQDDLIAKQHKILTALYNYRYLSLATAITASIIALLTFAFCIYSAGYRQVREEDDRIFCGKRHNVLLTWRQQIPLELYVIAALFILRILAAYVISGLDCLLNGTIPGWLAIATTEGYIILTLGWGLMFCMNIAHRAHGGILGKYTLYHWLWSNAKKGANAVRQHTSLLVKGAIALAGINILEFVIIIFSWGNGSGFTLLFFWGWLKIIEFALAATALIQLKTLQKGSEDLAEGNLSQQMDTGKMFWEFKKHGENLNKIHQGMSIALEERMKSERFKTELITNVSHDIKTPLTSIINYVDLLQKQGLTQEEQVEYLEVLDRQSQRLKKLIEDLIEASKASTGNLSVSLEPCNIDILLTQTVGEFQERLSASSLELITSGTGSNIQIQADSRHLWRIFDNLMNNICKYAQPGTRVYVSQEKFGGHVSIVFRNTSKEPLNISVEELMERFVRGDSSRNTEGNGLGLSIARSLTELMGGNFQIAVDGDLFKVTVKFSL